MEPGELKPILTALVMPPASFLLLALFGLALGMRRRVAGAAVATGAIVSLWLVSCNAVAVMLTHLLLPQFAPAAERDLASVHAIVVLGGGMDVVAPEYGAAQPSAVSLQRIRYGAYLARRTGKPLAFTSGVGWSGVGLTTIPESEAANRVLVQELGVTPRWLESRSRDTRENARLTAAMLLPAGVRRVAVVTDATHMARSVRAFREAGFDVVPAPTAFHGAAQRTALEWLPSMHGLVQSRYAFHEWLGLLVT